MPRRRLEERDLRSLERRSMYSIFRALDPNERPLKSRPYLPEFSWKFAFALLWFPALLALVQLELFLPLPQAVGWLVVVAFCFAYLVAMVAVLRKL